MFKNALVACLACALLASAGCDTMKSGWKSTRKLYKEYVNVDPTIDLTNQGITDPSLQKLAGLFAPVDERLELLLRSLSSQDQPPGLEWSQTFMETFPWVTGMVVLGKAGGVINRLPAVSMKNVDFTPLLAFEKHYGSRRMAAVAVADELGVEMMIAKPLFVDNDYQGLLVVHFDMGNLAKFSPEPGKLVILLPDMVGWPGDDAGVANALAGLKWKNILKDNVQGEERLGGTKYVWQSRFVAQTQLVYVVEGAAPVAKKPAQPAPKPVPEPAPQAAPELRSQPAPVQ